MKDDLRYQLVEKGLKIGKTFKLLAAELNTQNLLTDNMLIWGPGPLASWYYKHRGQSVMTTQVVHSGLPKTAKVYEATSIEKELDTFIHKIFKMNIDRGKKVYVTSALNDLLDTIENGETHV